MTRHRWALAAAFLLAGASPLSAQIFDWQHRWYWGVKAGVLGYTLPTLGQVFVPQFGGEWLITAKRTALYASFSTSTTTELDNYTFTGVTGTVPILFDGMRRMQIGVVVLPLNGTFQPYAGAGFVIETLTNPGIDPSASVSSSVRTTVENQLGDASSGGFALVMAGVQLRFGRKLALYGHYQGSPQGRAFLLRGSSHSIEGGIRYAFLSSREDDVTSRR
jgi:opacity protein-like surface antigen